MNVPDGTPLTALPAIQGLVYFGKTVRRAATSALTFYDLLIETGFTDKYKNN